MSQAKTKVEDPASFRDPSGFVFYRNGRPHRQINQAYREQYASLMRSGLYTDLVGREALIPHEELASVPEDDGEAYLVILPDKIPFISYPYEWCFSQLRDAALLTLEIQERAMAFGMSLKDASAFNIQFHCGRPVLMDTLSFDTLREGEPWIAYRQFCQHFLAPLALMARTDDRLGSLSRIHLDGVPLDLAATLLPFATRFNPGLLMHIHLHARGQRAFSDTHGAGNEPRGAGRMRMGKGAMQELVRSLARTVKVLGGKGRRTEWGGYYGDNSYSEAGLSAKREIVSRLIGLAKPATLWDLGANSGMFSRLASAQGIETLSFDIDHAAVEANYLEMRAARQEKLLPLLLDLTNPSPALGWENLERRSLSDRGPVDACMALALIHHLAISNNLPLERIARFFAGLCGSLIIEFVPKSDVQVKRLLSARPDIFPGYHEEGFTAAFSRHFGIRERVPVPDSDRAIYLLEKIVA